MFNIELLYVVAAHLILLLKELLRVAQLESILITPHSCAETSFHLLSWFQPTKDQLHIVVMFATLSSASQCCCELLI